MRQWTEQFLLFFCAPDTDPMAKRHNLLCHCRVLKPTTDRALRSGPSPPTVQDHGPLVNDRCGVCYKTHCGTSIHRGLWITSPQEWLPLGRPGPCTSSPGWPLTHPVCAWWPWRDGGGDFSPAKQRVVIDVAETSVLIFCSLTAFL